MLGRVVGAGIEEVPSQQSQVGHDRLHLSGVPRVARNDQRDQVGERALVSLGNHPLHPRLELSCAAHPAHPQPGARIRLRMGVDEA